MYRERKKNTSNRREINNETNYATKRSGNSSNKMTVKEEEKKRWKWADDQSALDMFSPEQKKIKKINKIQQQVYGKKAAKFRIDLIGFSSFKSEKL